MKTIGLLGGTGWSSTIDYYKILNELVAKRLGGYHSAKILLKSVDYHDIMSNYGTNNPKVAEILQQELKGLIALKPDCILICCNSLHKFYDMIKDNLSLPMPLFHAVDLTAEHLIQGNQKRVLLLATKFTMEDGFFTKNLEQKGISVTIPNPEERKIMQEIHNELMENKITQNARVYFETLIKQYSNLDAVILGCTEYPLLINQTNSALPVVNPVFLQASSAVDYVLEDVRSDKPIPSK